MAWKSDETMMVEQEKSSLDEQYEEAEALLDVYDREGGFLWLNRPNTVNDGEMAYSITVKGGHTTKDSHTPLTVTFIITLPRGYPNDRNALPEILAVEGSEPIVVKRLDEFSRQALNTVKAQVKVGYAFPLLTALESIKGTLTDIGKGDDEDEIDDIRIDKELEIPETIDDMSIEDILNSKPRVLGRRMLGIVHIRNKEHMKYCNKLANEWHLGGMGNPNAIVIEGDERLCIRYTDEMIHYIKKVTVRGEEQIPIPEGKTLDDMRALPKSFEFVGINEIDKIAKLCRDHGLEELFLTYLKVYGGRQRGVKK